MITLTYGRQYPPDGKISKAQLNFFLTFLRQKLGKVAYIWVTEFQKRGAVHYHVLLDTPTPPKLFCMEAGLKWVTITQPSRETYRRRKGSYLTSDFEQAVRFNTHSEFWQPLRERDAAARYLSKYLLKSEQKIVPGNYRNVGRFWGTSRGLEMITPKRVMLSEDELRSFLTASDHRLSNWKVLPKFINGQINGLEFDSVDYSDYTHK
jgi:hypothetical protein